MKSRQVNVDIEVQAADGTFEGFLRSYEDLTGSGWSGVSVL